MKTIIVKNLITEQKETYYNRYDLKENLISSIIAVNNQMSNLLNTNLRQKYSSEVEYIASKKGGVFAYAQNYDLIAYIQL